MTPAEIVAAGDGVRPARARRRGLSRPASSGRRFSIRRATQKYIVCNADEGDSGTFSDRMIMEGDPFVLIEGMAIAGIADRRHQGLRLSRAPNIRTPSRCMQEAIGSRPRGRHPRAERARLGTRLRHRGARRRRRLCLRRGDVAARLPRRQARPGARQAAAAGAQGPVRQADGHQQRASRWPPCRSSWTGARPSTAISAWAARAARSRSSSPATSSMAACSRRPSA